MKPNLLMIDPQVSLKNINESLKQIQHEMNPSLLEPSHLEWGSFLEKVSQISELYGKLIEQLSPELQNYVTFPTKFDSFDSSVPNGNLLALDKNNPIIQQRQQTRENYQNYLEENSLADADVEARMNRVMSDINEHNDACKQVLEMFDEIITRDRLAEHINEANPVPNEPTTDFRMFDFLSK